MNATLPLGRWSGIPVRMHWSVLVVCALLAQVMATVVLPAAGGYDTATRWIAGVAVAVVFMATLLAHELAHALVARRHGIGVQSVTLWLLGGVTEFGDHSPSPKAELWVAAAGPLASVGCGVLFGAVAMLAGQWQLPPVVVAGAGWLAAANLLLAVVNVLPGAPLDGGRILRAVLWRRSGDRVRATVTAARAGTVLGVGLMALGGIEVIAGVLSGLWLVLLGWFLFEVAAAEGRQANVSHCLGSLTAGEAMTTEPATAAGWWTVETFLDRTARHQRHRVFPVVDFSGDVCGVVSLAELAALPVAQRGTTTVSAAARPLRRTPQASVSTTLAELARGSRLDSGRDLVLVLDGHRLLGVISPSDIARTMELTALDHRPSGQATELPQQRPEKWRPAG